MSAKIRDYDEWAIVVSFFCLDSNKNKTKGHTQLPARSKNSTHASPAIGRINAVLKAQMVAQSNIGRIGFRSTMSAIDKSIMPITCIAVMAFSPLIPTVCK